MLYVKMIYRLYVHAKSLQQCPTLCNPMDCSLPGSSVYGILQARMLEWIGMPSSRGSSQTRAQSHISQVSYISRWVLYHQGHLGSPLGCTISCKVNTAAMIVGSLAPLGKHLKKLDSKLELMSHPPILVSCWGFTDSEECNRMALNFAVI